MEDSNFDLFEESNTDNDLMNELLSDFTLKIFTKVKNQVKEYYEQIQKENAELKKRVEEYRVKEREISDLKYLLQQERRDLEKNFLRMKFIEATSGLLKTCWMVDYNHIQKEKCNFCDENRKLIYTAINGKSIKENCDCARFISFYSPIELVLFDSNITKKSGEQFYLTARYSRKEPKDSGNTLQDVRFENTKTIREKFDPLIIEYPRIYSTLEECQKHCDFINNKKEQ